MGKIKLPDIVAIGGYNSTFVAKNKVISAIPLNAK